MTEVQPRVNVGEVQAQATLQHPTHFSGVHRVAAFHQYNGANRLNENKKRSSPPMLDADAQQSQNDVRRAGIRQFAMTMCM